MDPINIAHPVAAAAIPHCPVTRSRDVAPLCEVDGYHVWRCPASATDFVWPAPTDTELKRYYDRPDWFEGGEVGGYADYDDQTEFSLPMVTSLLDAFPADDATRYVLDIGCGYGTHLKLAADCGWKCFGVELSDHARRTAIDRHGSSMYVVEEVEQLVPHEFDLVLMLDVLEHVADPYTLLFRLFNQGLIGPKTRLVITTPNARSVDAVDDPDHWAYRHPPSHLVYFSARSLKLLLKNLLFDKVSVRGASPIPRKERRTFADETLTDDESLSGHAGLICEAEGSRFFGFMQERYVPGTWSRLAEYEHMPRYQFSRQFAVGKTVLDFGCGTGYGSRQLADVAVEVVGLDIDQEALDWAAVWHDRARLRFDRRDDLGAGLPSASFDLVTCFEMIEHVDQRTQIEAIRNISRLVRRDGMLIISTPNPAVTANYGENPYHLREMNEDQFRALLTQFFNHVTIQRQWIRPSITIGSIAERQLGNVVADRLPSTDLYEEPAAYVAMCSHRPHANAAPFITLDASADYVLVELRRQQAETALRFANYALREKAVAAEALAVQYRRGYEEALRQIEDKDRGLAAQAVALTDFERFRVEKEGAFGEQQQQIELLQRTIAEAGDASGAAARAQELDAIVAGLYQEVSERDESLRIQGAQLSTLNQYWIDKEAAFAEQARHIALLNESIAESVRTVEARDAELASREQYRIDKEAAFAEQARQIALLNDAVVAGIQAVEARDTELAKLEGYRIVKEEAFAEQARQIALLNDAVVAGLSNLSQRDEDLHKYEQYRVDKEAAFATQAEHIATVGHDLGELRNAIAARDADLESMQQMVASLDTDLQIARDARAAVESREVEQARAFASTLEIISELEQQRIDTAALVAERDALIMTVERMRREFQAADDERASLARRISELERSRAVKLALFVRGIKRDATATVGAETDTALSTRSSLLPFRRGSAAPAVARAGFVAYAVRTPKKVSRHRPRVLHAIANFMTGGSSRLVVDLLERLGDRYEQKILTSFIPKPPEYLNVDIVELPMGTEQDRFAKAIAAFAPDIVHVHYWGDCDEPWYREVFVAADARKLPIIQNVNTPVAPYVDIGSDHTIFVSQYVLDQFGQLADNREVIYPGSDFSHFERRSDSLENACVGMVYRLEEDKLNQSAIDVFIRIATARPDVKCLIVGGGSLLEPFRSRVRSAGCEDSFEFTGYVSYERLPELYARMGIFIAPVWKESFGQVSSFAMNMGIPVIGYDVGAIPEIVDDASLVAPAGDASALTDIAIALLDDRPRRQRIAESNQKRAADLFSVDAMVERYRSVYERTMQPK